MRRHRLLSLLFIGCLTIALFAGSAASSQIVQAALDQPAAIAKSSAVSQSGSTPPSSTANANLSLTAGVRKTILDNGLTVLTKQVNTSPVVSVQVWYRVGSRDEAPGVSALKHQLEHLMFKGTQARPIQFGRFFSALGSNSNAFTSYDMTAYFGTVERDKLEALLVLEADRTRNFIIGEKELDSEKRVVISELQGYENNPSYRLGRAVMRSAFPTSPYGLPVGGTKADVEKFTVAPLAYSNKSVKRESPMQKLPTPSDRSPVPIR